MNLSPESQKKLHEFMAKTAQAYGGTAGQQFTATPSVAQTLNDKIVQDGGPFLARINTVPVPEIKGQKVLMGVSGTVSGRTDTSGSGERVARSLVALDDQDYELKKTDSDVALKYATIDAWAKFPDFEARFGAAIRVAIANDRLRIGWHGTSAAATTNRTNNPNLEDVNIGWLKQIRDWNTGSQYVDGSSGAVVLGSDDFANLDTLVHYAAGLMAPEFRAMPGRIALISEDLIMEEEAQFYAEQGRRPTEKLANLDSMIVRMYGGLPCLTPPFFPDGTLLITTFANLSIYWQSTSWRRQQIDNPKKDQYEDFNTRNEGYVIEQFGLTSLVDGITIQQ
jgi:P2 family phage major capsid protein